MDFEPTKIAQRIEQERKIKGLAVRKASAAAEISEGRWRQIAKGYQQVTSEVRAPVRAPAETLARMAASVGLSGDDIAALEIPHSSPDGELAFDVITTLNIMDRVDSFEPESEPVFSGSYSDPNYLANIEGWVRQVQDKVDVLTRRVEVLERKATKRQAPDYSSLSQDDHGLAAYEGDERIAFDADPED